VAVEDLQTGNVTATYTSTHTNHNLELEECKHLPLPESTIKRVKTLIANDVQMEKIMDGVLILQQQNEL